MLGNGSWIFLSLNLWIVDYDFYSQGNLNILLKNSFYTVLWSRVHSGIDVVRSTDSTCSDSYNFIRNLIGDTILL